MLAVSYNLAHWTAHAAGLGCVIIKTLQLTIIIVPARLVTSARRPRLRLPTHWPWADAIRGAVALFVGIPAPG